MGTPIAIGLSIRSAVTGIEIGEPGGPVPTWDWWMSSICWSTLQTHPAASVVLSKSGVFPLGGRIEQAARLTIFKSKELEKYNYDFSGIGIGIDLAAEFGWKEAGEDLREFMVAWPDNGTIRYAVGPNLKNMIVEQHPYFQPRYWVLNAVGVAGQIKWCQRKSSCMLRSDRLLLSKPWRSTFACTYDSSRKDQTFSTGIFRTTLMSVCVVREFSTSDASIRSIVVVCSWTVADSRGFPVRRKW